MNTFDIRDGLGVAREKTARWLWCCGKVQTT
jgi:hypothetical protein